MEKIKVGDKEYTIEEITQQLTQGAQAMQQLGAVNQVAGRLGLKTDEFVEQAQNAFGALVGLQEQGIIDAQGVVVKKEAPKVPEPKPDQKSTGIPNADEIAAIALGKVQGPLSNLEQQIKQIQDSQQRIGRSILLGQIKSKHPNLDDEEIEFAMTKAVSQKRDIWEVAKERSEKLGGLQKGAVDTFAKEKGLNLERINRLDEMRNSEGGVAKAVVEGKKLSFKRGEEGAITPREALETHMNIALGKGE